MKRKKIRRCWRLILSGILAMTLGASIPVQAAPSGVLKQAIHWGLSGDWLDPATNPGLISSQIILYLFHDALVKPMPQGNLSPSLAESWTISPDARVYEFKLRQGVEFHIISEPATRVAMVRRGEVDIATLMQGVFYEDVKKDPKLRLLHPLSPVTWIVYIGQQFDPKSPWADPRVRKAASLAIDRKSLADIFMPGCKPVGSMAMDGDPFGVPFPPDPYDPAQAKKLLAEAGYPKGFEGGKFYPYKGGYWPYGEQVMTYWKAVGINVEAVLLDRPAWFANRQGGKMKGVLFIDPAALGAIGGRLGYLFGPTSYGIYPDIKALWDQYRTEVNPKARKDLMERIQKMIHERTMFIPLTDTNSPAAFGPRVKGNPYKIQPLIWFTAPFEDMELVN